jgi:radical SAM superfamily enzyme YgiQ (UPF0313 family)
MSNLAVHLLYGILNDMPEVVCERAFWEPPGVPRSVESGRGLTSFSVLFLTLSYELDYVNIPAILKSAGIPVFSRDRREEDPLVIAGGICVMANPEPLHAFFDLFILGDIETTIPAFMDGYRAARQGGRDRAVDALSLLPWVYNPALLSVEYDGSGPVRRFVPPGFAVTVQGHRGDGLAHSVVTARDTEFSGMYLVEGTRGCPSRCPFCLLGNSYAFVHEDVTVPDDTIRSVGIVGGGVSFHPRLAAIIEGLREKGITVHLPSLRIDEVPIEVIDMLKDDVKTLTFGVEAGTERLRRFVGKPMDDEDILSRMSQILAMKSFNVKLYFMIGLYGEGTEDVDAIVSLTKKIKHLMIKAGAPRGAVGSVTVHVSPFVPKAWTPFQWLPMDDPGSLREKIARLRRGLGKVDNVFFTHESVKFSFVQAVLARGDRRVNDLIVRLSSGQGFQKIVNETVVNVNFYALRRRENDELFPWDFIGRGVDKERLHRRLTLLLSAAGLT